LIPGSQLENDQRMEEKKKNYPKKGKNLPREIRHPDPEGRTNPKKRKFESLEDPVKESRFDHNRPLAVN